MNNIKKFWKKEYILTTIFVLLLVGIILPMAIAPNTVGNNHKNVTVNTYVNITNAKPEVLNVTIYESTNTSFFNVTVTAGSTKKVYCNATVRDWDGFNDIVNATGILWHLVNSSENASNDNSTHYTNSSCTLNASLSAYVGWYVCAFDVWYYANNGTWNCNVTVFNSYNFKSAYNNSTTVQPLYAINLSEGIDFGSVESLIPSNNISVSMTNFGNMLINVSIQGYALIIGDNVGMNCSDHTNISISNIKFSTNSSHIFSDKNSLNGSIQNLDLQIPKQTGVTQIVNNTYWQISPDAGSLNRVCGGYVLFTAEAP